MEQEQIKRAIRFSNLIETWDRERFRYLLVWLGDFGLIYDEEKAKLPYHINVIDELHANENAHSRIFAKLLRYQENNKYLFLEKFLNQVCSFNLSIEQPTVEKVDSCGRIDIPIFDKKFVVVIENKVTDKASDQNNSKGGQLARYIETIKDKYDRKLEEIFIVYTPKYSREPSIGSWLNKDNYSYKDDFKYRFRSLSYRDDIYPWLKNTVLPNVEKNNKYLRSAIEQYIDHLEGIFNLRSINKDMNMKLQEFIKKELELQDDLPEKAIEILSEKELELNNAINQIQQLKNKYQKQIVTNYFEKWEKLLRLDFPDFEIVGDKFKLNESIINLGIKISIENKKFVAIIESDENDNFRIYFGAGRHFVSGDKFLIPALQKILEENELKENNDYWYGWKYTSLDDTYLEFKAFIEQITTKLVKSPNG